MLWYRGGNREPIEIKNMVTPHIQNALTWIDELSAKHQQSYGYFEAAKKEMLKALDSRFNEATLKATFIVAAKKEILTICPNCSKTIRIILQGQEK